MRARLRLTHRFLLDFGRMLLVFAFLSFFYFLHWGLGPPDRLAAGLLIGFISFVVLLTMDYFVYRLASRTREDA